MGTSVFGEEHAALADSVRRFVEQEVSPALAACERAGAVAAQVRGQAGQLGYLEAWLDDPLSGLALAEELGRSGSLGLANSLLTTAAGVLPMLNAAKGRQIADLCDRVAAGRAIVALALWEPGLADLSETATAALPSDGGWRLEGRKTAVVDARNATAALILAATPVTGHGVQGPHRGPARGTPAVFLATTGDEGWAPLDTPAPLGAGAAGTADVGLRGLPGVPIGLDLESAREAQRRLWLAQSAALVADAWRTWQRTVGYAGTREVFGRPVLKFQVNRHALAQALTRLTAARRLVHDAAYRLAQREDAGRVIAAARRFAGEAASAVTDTCLQLHGGYGYSLEYDVQRSWRDDRALTLDGTADALHAQIEEGLVRV